MRDVLASIKDRYLNYTYSNNYVHTERITKSLKYFLLNFQLTNVILIWYCPTAHP